VPLTTTTTAEQLAVRGDEVAAQLQALLEEVHGGSWQAVVAHVENVKSYAPRVYHVVYDIHCTPY
jgi:tRNA G37 N-methylase Trm5